MTADATTGPGSATTAGDWDAAAFRAQVQEVLDGFIDDQQSAVAELGDDAVQLVGAARDAVAGGKRLRAMFAWWGFHAVRAPMDASETAGLLRATAALELLHASALVHDDYMDASDTRRGRPSAHRAFATRMREERWPGNPEQYGAAAAILLGDLMLSWADEMLRGCGLPSERVLEALRWFDVTRTEVIAGQFLDVSVQARGEADVEQSMKVLRYKSAKYSVERPLHVGAALAGAAPEDIQLLTDYGLPLGEAFQLRDDLLGVFGDPEVTGKPAGDDLSEGKRTVLVALALAGAGEDDALQLQRQLGHRLDGREVAELQRIIERSGAHAEVERRIEELTDRCLRALDHERINPAARDTLRQLAAAATQRVV